MQNLLDYFTRGTEQTATGASWGAEIETHFVTARGHAHVPIPPHTTRQMLKAIPAGPWQLKPELGRQLLELAICPQPSPSKLLDVTHEALDWLYTIGKKYGATPCLFPILDWQSNLLLEPENTADGRRDELFIQLDGRPALEELCRIAAVQFTISVSPTDAISWINQLWAARLHQLDYPNDAYWQRYIKQADAKYNQLRYGGPSHFADLHDYALRLTQHHVIMDADGVCSRPTTSLGGDVEAINMFLRSVWWHYRLRRYNTTLALEIRPLARRDDQTISSSLHKVRQILSI